MRGRPRGTTPPLGLRAHEERLLGHFASACGVVFVSESLPVHYSETIQKIDERQDGLSESVKVDDD
jgi:hypothetical protein